MNIEILGTPLSPYVFKTVTAVEYKGIPHTYTGYQEVWDFKRYNPKTRKVPAALIDGQRIHDSTTILHKLEELFPERPIFSSDPKVAAKQRLLEDWSDESVYFQMMALRWMPSNIDATVAQNAKYVKSPAWLMPFQKPIQLKISGGAIKTQGMGRLSFDELMIVIRRSLDDLSTLLDDHPYFYADEPSIADFAIYGQFSTGCTPASPEFTAEVLARPNLVAWVKRIEEVSGRPLLFSLPARA